MVGGRIGRVESVGVWPMAKKFVGRRRGVSFGKFGSIINERISDDRGGGVTKKAFGAPLEKVRCACL